ncbi:MAG: hypothetical protein C0497_05695 [Gemmatimonas sp.]|nr:hypothetical protein [Gemmatimonas sp.]
MRLDDTLGSLVKQAMRTRRPMRSQPSSLTISFNIRSNVTPCSGSEGRLGRSGGMFMDPNDCLCEHLAPAASARVRLRHAIFRRMKLWIDADATPLAVKQVCFRASDRLKLDTVLVANQRVQFPAGYAYLSAVRVDAGPDEADRYIVEHAQSGDVAVTADIPLVALLVPKDVAVIDPRGAACAMTTVARTLQAL